MPKTSPREKLSPGHFTTEPQAKYIGTAISVEFHSELREAAKEQGITLGAYLREALLNFHRSDAHENG